MSTAQLTLLVFLPAYVLLIAVTYLVARLRSIAKSKSTGVREPVNLGVVGGILVLPLLLVGALLSIPCTWVWRNVQSRKEARFAEAMKRVQRSISWEEAEHHVSGKQGTLICETLSMKGPSRLWWTPDFVPDVSPFPYVRSKDKEHICFEKEFAAFGKRCFERYTSPTCGKAVLVGQPKMDRQDSWQQVGRLGYIATYWRDAAGRDNKRRSEANQP